MATFKIKFQDAELLQRYNLLRDIEESTIDEESKTFTISSIPYLRRLILNVTRLRNIFLNQCRETHQIKDFDLLSYLPEITDYAAQASYIIQKHEAAAQTWVSLLEVKGITDKDADNLCDNIVNYK